MMNRWLLLVCTIIVLTLLAGCQAGPRPIQAEYVLAGPPIEESATEIDGECLLNLVFPWEIEGNLQGTAVTDYKILLHGPCDNSGEIGEFDESWIYSGSFDGELDGKDGTFDYYAFGEINDQLLTGQLAIVPGSGGGELTNIAGVLSFEEVVGGDEPTPLSGYYYFNPAPTP